MNILKKLWFRSEVIEVMKQRFGVPEKLALLLTKELADGIEGLRQTGENSYDVARLTLLYAESNYDELKRWYAENVETKGKDT